MGFFGSLTLHNVLECSGAGAQNYQNRSEKLIFPTKGGFSDDSQLWSAYVLACDDGTIHLEMHHVKMPSQRD